MARALLILVFLVTGCGSDSSLETGHFPCGAHGGSCESGVEVCVVVDGCSTCAPVPAACQASSECACLDGSVDAVTQSCLDDGGCALVDGGLTVECMETNPPTGCG